MNLNKIFRAAKTKPEVRRLAIAGVVLLMLIVVAGWWLQPAEAEAPKPVHPAAVASSASAPTVPGRVDSYADVVSQVAPAVVTIRSERRVRATSFGDGDAENFFQQFFGRSMPQMRQQPQIEGALGSGVIVRADGYILTNNHVVANAQQIRVELPDHRTFPAKLIGADAPSDLAVLKINATNLPVVKIGDSSKMRVGDVVLAIGDPLGVGETVTMGIVSAKGRATGLSDGSAYENFIQTDAPINQGNSGGALVNTSGELIGINSQIMTPSGGNIGIGFAIPSDQAENVMGQIIKTGTVRRGMLGVNVQNVTSDMAANLGLKEVRGAIVSSVESGSPADRAGVQQGDVIIAINGRPVSDMNELRNGIAGMAPGSRVTLTVLRDGRERQVETTLAQVPNKDRASNDNGGPDEHGRLGLSVEPLTPSVASQLGTKTRTGLVVDSVAPGSPAADAGLREGDIIKQVNRKPVNSASELQQAVRDSGNRPALMLVERDGNNLFVAVATGRS